MNHQSSEQCPISLTKIAQIINAAAVPAFVGQTGGGVATLFIGTPSGGNYPLVAGPGEFSEDGEAVIYFGDFCYGREVNGEIVSPQFITEGDEAAIAQTFLKILLPQNNSILN